MEAVWDTRAFGPQSHLELGTCTVLTQPLRRLLQITCRISDGPCRKFRTLGRYTPWAKNFFQSRRCEQGKEAKPRRADNKRVRHKLGHKHALAGFHLESVLSHIDVELSFQD